MQHPERASQLTDVRGFLHVLRRRRGPVVLVTILVTALALGFVAWRSPVYTSLAQVEVRPLTIDEQLQPFASDSFVNMDTEAARVTQEPVTKLAAPALGLDPDSPSDLAEAVADVDVSVQVNTTFLEISCTKGSATRARDCASAFAAAYVQDRVESARSLYEERVQSEQEKIQAANGQIELLSERLEQLSEDDVAARALVQAEIATQSQLIVAAQTNLLSLPTASPGAAMLARSADLPTEPSNKDFLPTAGLAVLLGFALGIGLALLRERVAEPISAEGELEQALQAPVLAAVPTLGTRRYRREPNLITVSAPESPGSQAYQAAGAALVHLAREGSLKVIAVTGPKEGEGKTPATANLAVVLARSGRRVVAMSCDLRNPTLHRFFDRANDVGVTNVLRDRTPISEVLQQTDVPDLFVIASGPAQGSPTDLLGSEGMGQLLADLRSGFDFVLVDAGPGLVADVLFLVPHADGVIVVADAATTSRGAVAHLRHQLASTGGLVIGGIVNNWISRHAGHPYAYSRTDPGPQDTPRQGERRAEVDGEDRAVSEWRAIPPTVRAARPARSPEGTVTDVGASAVGSRPDVEDRR